VQPPQRCCRQDLANEFHNLDARWRRRCRRRNHGWRVRSFLKTADVLAMVCGGWVGDMDGVFYSKGRSRLIFVYHFGDILAVIPTKSYSRSFMYMYSILFLVRGNDHKIGSRVKIVLNDPVLLSPACSVLPTRLSPAAPSAEKPRRLLTKQSVKGKSSESLLSGLLWHPISGSKRSDVKSTDTPRYYYA